MTNLFQHLKWKNMQRLLWSGAQPHSSASRQPSLTEVLEQPGKYDKSSKRWKEAANTVTFYLAKDKIPFKAVGKGNFKKLMHTLV